MFRFVTAGESHGQALIAWISGVPAGVPIDFDFVQRELHRRSRNSVLKLNAAHAPRPNVLRPKPMPRGRGLMPSGRGLMPNERGLKRIERGWKRKQMPHAARARQ